MGSSTGMRGSNRGRYAIEDAGFRPSKYSQRTTTAVAVGAKLSIHLGDFVIRCLRSNKELRGHVGVPCYRCWSTFM